MARQCEEHKRAKRRVRRSLLKRKKLEKERLLGASKKQQLTPDKISKLTEKPTPRYSGWY